METSDPGPCTRPYTGTVVPGGPGQVRELPDAVIRKIAVSDFNNNVYLITCRGSGRRLLVDAADDAPRLLALLAEEPSTDGAERGRPALDLLLTTHQHWDHHRALAEVASATGATTLAGREDAEALPLAPDRVLDHGDTLQVGDLALEVAHLRGHTPGSVALTLRSVDGSVHVFTGDCLFPGGVGNTQDDPARFTSLLDDVEQRLFAVLPDEAWIYPGHGDDTTIGAQRPHLAEWRERGW